MKRVALVVVTALIVFLGILLVVPGFINWNKYHDQIVNQLHEATGYDYSIAGGIELAILPYPHVAIGDLTVTNPAHGNIEILTLEKVDVAVALKPLLGGKVAVESVSLDKPRVNLEISASGERLWLTPKLEKMMVKDSGRNSGATDNPASKNEFLDKVSLEAIRIKGGAFSYSDQMSGKTHQLSDINLSLRGDTVFGPYVVDGDLFYQQEKVALKINSGRIGSDVESITLKARVELPAQNSSLDFSGIVSLSPVLEVQGDTTLDVQNLKALMISLGTQNTDMFVSGGASVTGMLTASVFEIAFHNMALSYAGEKFGGSVIAKNLIGSDDVGDITLNLSAETVVNLHKLLPVKGKGKSSEKKTKSFLPSVISLPDDFKFELGFLGTALDYNGFVLSRPVVEAYIKDRKVTFDLEGVLPGEGVLGMALAMDFESASKTEATGKLTLTDPVLSYNVDLNIKDGALLAQEIAVLKPIAGLLNEGLSVQVKGGIAPEKVSVDKGSLRIMNNNLYYKGAYKVGANKPALDVIASAGLINFDTWQAALSKKEEVATEKTNVKDIAAQADLPFDLSVSLAVDSVTFQKNQYDKLEVLGQLNNKKLTVETFGLSSNAGDNLLLAGGVENIQTLEGIDLSLEGKTGNVKNILNGFGVDTKTLPEAIQTVEVLSSFKGNKKSLDFTSNVKALKASLDVQGKLANPFSSPTVSGVTLRLKHADYADLLRNFNPKFKGRSGSSKSFDIYAGISQEGKIYNLSDLRAAIGPAAFTGIVSVDVSAKKPYIKANLNTESLPLEALLSGKKKKTMGNIQAQPLRSKPSNKWSRDVINMAWLNTLNMDLSAQAKSVSYGVWDIQNADIIVALKEGTLDVSKFDGALMGGTLDLTAQVRGAQTLSVTSAVKLDNISLEKFVGAFSGSKLLQATGNISFSSDVKTNGKSQVELVSGLSGNANATGSNIVFSGFDLAKLSRTLAQPSSSMTENLTSLMGVSMGGGSTKFDSLDMKAPINKGVANMDLILKGPDAIVTGKGSINLPLWQIDLTTVIDLVEPADAPNLSIDFKGPLDKPVQTFGKGALENYMGNIVGQELQNLLEDKLGLPKRPAPTPSPANDNTQPVQQTPQEFTPEDAFRGILNGVLGGQ